ncbi:glutamyl-tRNA reductase [Capnocytophaga sp. oral taxon 338]|uniref:glutamyl-tRNA reductase n=1 Tax=Capnocytophaga sp. oral taxon 338 TaxID=710239 RepID=UPI000202FB7E|nr:glutamyl-tRNA reductase [Capnocytophaga sp. oral taxon 338]EGD34370.1 glutamyl-tRNA reductase [Capnocytophaga sp. oral taxon 338 str. F0234]
MTQNTIQKETHFYTIGISYKKADADMRGLFSLDTEHQESILAEAQAGKMEGLAIISTCNRTELYGFAEHPFQLIQKLCTHSKATLEDFEKVGYIYKNKEAVNHLFNVGTGLDSQILGDFEVISQLKKSFSLAKQYHLINAFLERLLNSVIQASKRIKNETELSSGATSVSFASVQYILQNVTDISNKKILLFGTGKIGRNTCENLIKHTNNEHITLINRTKEKAQEIAGKFNVLVKDYALLESELAQTDVLVVATGSKTPTITEEILPKDRKMLILDLSIPKNVADSVQRMDKVTLIHMDHLSQITDDTLERRKAFIPQAQQIIEEIKEEFDQWLQNRRFAPTIQALKHSLEELKNGEIDFQRKKIPDFNEQQAEIISDRIIQKITTRFINHLKESASPEESLSLMKQVFEL